MKCYFAINAPKDEDVYNDLLEAAVKTARSNTSLQLVALYDGLANSRSIQILQKNNVEIIWHRFSRYEKLKELYPVTWMRENLNVVVPYSKLAGTFMRLDIPFIEEHDDFVLYTDVDVLFEKNFDIEDLPLPRYLAAAPEFEKDYRKMTYFNAGILMLNIKGMRKKCSDIFSLMDNGQRNATGLYDQGYLNQVCFDDADLLPLEFNWKPYWGVNDQAKIVHFHGIKPNSDYKHSGFGASADTVMWTLNGHEADLAGYMYYYSKYFRILGVDADKWLSEFLHSYLQSFLKTTNQPISSEQTVVTYSQVKRDLRFFIRRKIKEYIGV